jgi:hypothetical protein
MIRPSAKHPLFDTGSLSRKSGAEGLPAFPPSKCHTVTDVVVVPMVKRKNALKKRRFEVSQKCHKDCHTVTIVVGLARGVCTQLCNRTPASVPRFRLFAPMPPLCSGDGLSAIPARPQIASKGNAMTSADCLPQSRVVQSANIRIPQLTHELEPLGTHAHELSTHTALVAQARDTQQASSRKEKNGGTALPTPAGR